MVQPCPLPQLSERVCVCVGGGDNRAKTSLPPSLPPRVLSSGAEGDLTLPVAEVLWQLPSEHIYPAQRCLAQGENTVVNITKLRKNKIVE